MWWIIGGAVWLAGILVTWAICAVNGPLDDWDEQHRGIRRS